MPHLINGIGTWYLGKKNIQKYTGPCRYCGREAQLTSYDTRLWFLVVLVPVIPLGARHIIEECSSCRRHGAVPLHAWRLAQQRIDELVAAYRANPADGESARQAVTVCATHRNLMAFNGIAPEVETHCAADGKTLALLAQAYSLFGDINGEERALRAALEAAKDDEEADAISEALAESLIRLKRPDEAAPYLQHIIDDGIPDRVGSLWMLAQAYQLKGQHDKALELYGQCEAINPNVAQDKTFKRLRDESTKRLGTTKIVSPGALVQKQQRAASRNKFMKRAAVVLLVLAGGYAAVSVAQGFWQKVYLVSGVDHSYTVKVNGTPYLVPPRGVEPIRLMQGTVKIEVVDSALPLPVETMIVHDEWFKRPFSKSVFVINPDRSALLAAKVVHYGQQPVLQVDPDVPPPDVTFSVGKVLNTYQGVDAAFESLPEKISVSSNQKEDESRTQVVLADSETELKGAMLIAALADQLGPEPIVSAARGHLALTPEDSDYMQLLRAFAAPAAVIEFSRPLLDQRPLLINWHRAYQDSLQHEGNFDELEREYDQRLGRNPNDPDVMYLAGRATRDPAKAMTLCRRAASVEPTSAWAMYWVGGSDVETGNYAEAVTLLKSAREKLPDQRDIVWSYHRALVGAGKIAEAKELSKAAGRASLAEAFGGCMDEVNESAIQGRYDQAKESVERLRARFRKVEKGVDLVHQAEAEMAYCFGATSTFTATMGISSEAAKRFPAHVTAGDVDAAEKDLAELKPDAEHHLLMYLAATSTGRLESAQRHLQEAIQMLRQGDFEDQAYADALSRKSVRPTSTLLQMRCSPPDKVVRITALAVQDPSARTECVKAARAINIDRRFPYLLLNATLNTLAARGAS